MRYRGQLCNQLIGQEGGKDGCKHVSEREEDFFVLGLDVKGKRSITESLQLYVKGEVRGLCLAAINRGDALCFCR